MLRIPNSVFIIQILFLKFQLVHLEFQIVYIARNFKKYLRTVNSLSEMALINEKEAEKQANLVISPQQNLLVVTWHLKF